MSDVPRNERPSAPIVVLCDDDAAIRWSIAAHLKSDGYQVIEADDGLAFREVIGNEAARGYTNEPPAIVGTDDDRLNSEVQLLRSREHTGYEAFVGRSEALAPLFADLRHLEDVVAPTVLITGESGTGKDVVAHAIHANGPRKDHVFVDIDCTSLPEHLVESELFGHERGAFTDAKVAKRGLLEVVAGGVLFLDEIGELGLPIQSKLLRALENRTFKRVGGLANIRLDAGIIAATNQDLKKAVVEGRFREDLYYRLNVVSLRVPALRERSDDIPLLVMHILAKLNQQFGRAISGVDPKAMELMQAYPWPGNVRELKNVLERIAILGAPSHIRVDDLPAEVRFSDPEAAQASSGGGFLVALPVGGIDLDRVERELVVQALRRTNGNQTAAARLLGLTRYQLRSRAEKYDLKR